MGKQTYSQTNQALLHSVYTFTCCDKEEVEAAVVSEGIAPQKGRARASNSALSVHLSFAGQSRERERERDNVCVCACVLLLMLLLFFYFLPKRRTTSRKEFGQVQCFDNRYAVPHARISIGLLPPPSSSSDRDRDTRHTFMDPIVSQIAV